MKIDEQEAGTLPSYVFYLMTVYYLQQCQPPVLPVLQQVRVALLVCFLDNFHTGVRSKPKTLVVQVETLVASLIIAEGAQAKDNNDPTWPSLRISQCWSSCKCSVVIGVGVMTTEIG